MKIPQEQIYTNEPYLKETYPITGSYVFLHFFFFLI